MSQLHPIEYKIFIYLHSFHSKLIDLYAIYIYVALINKNIYIILYINIKMNLNIEIILSIIKIILKDNIYLIHNYNFEL